MKNRSANSTIKGYFYQFDFSILKILNLRTDDHVTLEGIEDVDLENVNDSVFYQCKYYEETEYNHSKIKGAIKNFLYDYSQRLNQGENKVKYTLYGHYSKGIEKLPQDISINFLKNKFLTETREGEKHLYYDELNLSDDNLLEFISLLEIDINAPSFDEQNKLILKKLEELFNCDEFEAEIFYYSNALRRIKELVVLKEKSCRKVNKNEFIESIDNKEIIFEKWQHQLLGKEKLYNKIRKKYFTKLNIGDTSRFFILDMSNHNYKRQKTKDLIYELVKKWSPHSKRVNSDIILYIYLYGLSETEQLALKNELWDDNLIFLDGYPYKGAVFDVDKIIQSSKFYNSAKFIFINNSKDLEEILKNLNGRKEIYNFYVNSKELSSYKDKSFNFTMKVENIYDVEEII